MHSRSDKMLLLVARAAARGLQTPNGAHSTHKTRVGLSIQWAVLRRHETDAGRRDRVPISNWARAGKHCAQLSTLTALLNWNCRERTSVLNAQGGGVGQRHGIVSASSERQCKGSHGLDRATRLFAKELCFLCLRGFVFAPALRARKSDRHQRNAWTRYRIGALTHNSRARGWNHAPGL